VRFVVDKHALIWFFAKNPALGNQARSVLLDPKSQLVVPSVALAECLWILTSRKLPIRSAELLAAIESDSRIEIYPLTGDMVVLAQSLTKISEIHDRQIAATALYLSTNNEKIPVITKDESISASKVIPTIW
jgi:PIN domain nuclease of toxin-antitoxin system